jgi:hypothetical protein
MTVQAAVELFKKCGYKIRKIEGSYFFSRGMVNYSFPQLIDIPINKKVITSLKWKYLISIIKTNSKLKNTYEFILATDNYDILKFAPKKRNDIRKSLKECIFIRPPLNDLIKYGLLINQRTLLKQKRKDKFLTKLSHWEKYISSLYDNEDVEILGAYIETRMVGYITVCKINNRYYIIDPYYDFSASSSSPTQGLIFTLVNRIIQKEGSIIIYYGLDSFSPLPSLNKYKLAMLFKKVPATRAYVLNPLLIPFLKMILIYFLAIKNKKNSGSRLIRNIIRLYKGHEILKKLESI